MTYHDPAGRVAGEFRKMRFLHPRVERAHSAFEALREARRIAPDDAQRYITIFAPTGSGKTRALLLYLEDVVVPELIAEGLLPADCDRTVEAKRQRRVLYYDLRSGENLNAVASGLLMLMGDENPDKYPAKQRMRRCYGMMKELGVELLIIDELNALKAKKRTVVDDKLKDRKGEMSMSVPDALRGMLNAGVVPIVFSGTEDAAEITESDLQLVRRELVYLRQNFNPYRWSDEEERKEFLNYLTVLSYAVVATDLVSAPPNFKAAGMLEKMWISSKGSVGIASQILEAATAHALRRGDEARMITKNDLAYGVNVVSIPQGIVKEGRNPFVVGIKDSDLSDPK